MDEKLKLLPTLMVSAALLLSLKLVGVWTGVEGWLAGAGIAHAASPAEPQAGDHPPKEDQGAPPPPPPASPPPPPTPGPGSAFRELEIQPKGEVEVLERLGERRTELDRREAELDMREKLLAATEQRVEERIAELKGIEARIEKTLRIRDEAEEAKIASLVKVYEAMKAKDAARIFESLEGEILLAVAERMREAKMADVLAEMSPGAAQSLTVRLATSARVPDGAADDAPPP